MDMEVLFHTIMTDPKGSKSNIAARFQNAFALQVSPPIGVFWDIENCQVPRGKSAITLVQNIREKFFENHREAEFMCVCDIHKESKIVIQELLFAQVTVVHISAISKNAADDKLKQCMKRFVDTHGSPATLLLISDDVNFASDLSDFRHRHNIRIILIHRGHAHQSLLTCAHEHHNFFTITQDLPTRSPAKSANNRPCELDVTGLPTNRKESHIKNYLQKLSSNCGGKVICVRGSRAIIRFANVDTAEKAKKRMDKELVFGNKISVNFRARTAVEFSYSPSRDFISSPESSVTHSPCSSRDSSPSPPPTNRAKITNYMCNIASEKKFDFPPPPVINDQNHPSLLWRGNPSKPQNCIDNSKSFSTANNSDLSKGRKVVAMGWNNIKAFCQTNEKYQDSAFSPFKKDPNADLKKYPPRNVGRVAPFVTDCETKNVPGHLNDLASNRHNPSTSNLYPMYTSQGFFPFNQSMPLQGNERMNDPTACSTQWVGAAIHGELVQSMPRCNVSSDGSAPVELHVSNLDSKFEVNEMKKMLLSVFSEHVMVLHISMSLQPDGSAKATVKVPSLQDAQYAISRFHRRQIGHKRILISHVSAEKNPPFHVLKSETVSLLNDIPSKNLPLIKFRELYEKRYHRPIAVSELYKMRDAVSIQGDSGSRIVYLNTDYCKTPSLPDSEDSQEFNAIERPYCERHFHVSDSQGWAEQYSICPLPIVCISLKTLSTAVHMLLDSHQGSLPLISFCDCYEAEIGSLPVIGCVKNLTSPDEEPSDDVADAAPSKGQKGVPLEHLIACVAGVEVANSPLCIKKVQWLENKIADSQILQNCSPALASQLSLFGREVMDLLKSQSRCLVAFNKFIPVYHHHFGRQCRVADYGFTKLIDLLEAIPHIVQVLGEGQNRQVTLTHRTQIKRFSAELLRILKSRASKQITIPEFPQVYEQVVEKPFDITNYGVCEIEDMLDEVPESIIGICKTETEVVIGIPKREQTAEEIERTKQFAAEVIELMKHTPYCTMSFNKFIPAYHHHFGKQCRVADYGFTKLIELFEAIPDILEVKGSGEEKILNLVPKEQHKILTDRLVSVLKSQPNEVIDINQISLVYAQMLGHVLRPRDFGFNDLLELLESMDSTLRIVIGYGRTYVTLVDHGVVHQISLNLCRLLMENQDCIMSVKDISKLYQSRFGQKINLSLHLQDMASLIQMKGDFIHLTPLLVLARDIILLLQDHDGQVSFSNFGSLFQQKYGMSICTSSHGFPNMYAMLESLADYFSLKGKKQKRLVCLNTESIGSPLPQFAHNNSSSNGFHVQQINSDILNYPIPSCVPSPNLEPRMTKRLEELLSFETSDEQVNGCLPGEVFNCAKRLIKKDSATETSNYTISPRESHPAPDCLSGIPSTSTAYFERQIYISSDAQNLRSEQSRTAQNPTVIETHFEHTSTHGVGHSNPGPSFESKSSVEKPKILREYSLSTQSLQISKEELECERMNVVAVRKGYPSTQSTPTQSSRQGGRRKIAAHFDTPLINFY